MKLNKVQTACLGIAGLTACVIGSVIALDPAGFYAGYGLNIETNTDMLSELRAPGVNLAVLGAVMLAGVLRESLRQMAISLGVLVFGAFAGGRILGLLLDGIPSSSVLIALSIEVVIALCCLWIYRQQDVNRRKAFNT